MIDKIFNKIIRAGVEPNMKASKRDETKLINSIAFHSVLITIFFGVLGLFLFQVHGLFILTLGLIEASAKTLVIVLNKNKKYGFAKVIFSFVTLFIFLALTAYFGINSGFQYAIITLFFALSVVFDNTTRIDGYISVVYLLLGGFGALAIMHFNSPIAELNELEMQVCQICSYMLNTSVIIMVSVIFFKSMKHRKMVSQESFKEVSGVATILNTISENIGDGIFKTDPKLGFQYMNEAFAHIFGYESSEQMWQVKPTQLYNSEADRDELLQEIDSKGFVNNRMVQYKKQNGTRFWGRITCKKIQEGEREFLVGIVSDVTVQQEHESVLKESEYQLREAQRIANIGNWQLFNASKILRWSEECARIHGYSENQTDYDYREWLDSLENADEMRLNTLMAKAMMTKENVEFESWFTTPNGERLYLKYVTRYQRSEKVKGGVWHGTVQDYTDQHLSEERILETKQFYESWLDSLPIESVMFDDDLRYIYISENAISNVETRNWLIGKRNADYAEMRGFADDFYLARDAKVREAIATNSKVVWEEKMETRSGGHTYHLRFALPMEINERGRPKKTIIGYSFDINDIKKAQIELEEKNAELVSVNKELDRFVYSISHDMRAPIASALGLIELMQQNELSKETNELVRMQHEALSRMDQYICDVLDFSRNARLDIEYTDIFVEDAVETCIASLQHFDGQDDVEISIDLEVKTIRTDNLRFRIILNNLLSNAYKYKDPEKETHKIIVSTFLSEEGYPVLCVQDNGIGIRKDFLGKVWDMFFRGTNLSTGSGLGLYILKESAEMVNAEVTVESEEKEGSKFEIEFKPVDYSSLETPEVSSSQSLG